MVTKSLSSNVLGRLEIEPRYTQQIAEDAQHLPRGTRLAERLDDTVEALHATFGVDEGARGLGKRRDGQKDISAIARGIGKRRECDHEFGLLEGRHRTRGISQVAIGFDMHQQASLERTVEHGRRVASSIDGQRVDELRSDGVGRRSQVTH